MQSPPQTDAHKGKDAKVGLVPLITAERLSAKSRFYFVCSKAHKTWQICHNLTIKFKMSGYETFLIIKL